MACCGHLQILEISPERLERSSIWNSWRSSTPSMHLLAPHHGIFEFNPIRFLHNEGSYILSFMHVPRLSGPLPFSDVYLSPAGTARVDHDDIRLCGQRFSSLEHSNGVLHSEEQLRHYNSLRSGFLAGQRAVGA